MKVKSRRENIKAEESKIFTLLTNFSNFGKVLPEQIQEWEATTDYCKFSIQGMMTLTLTIVEKIEFSKIRYQANNDRNISTFIEINISENKGISDIDIAIELDLPLFLTSMVNKPLQNFVDMMAEKIKVEAEKQQI